jgi:MFS family permease
LQTIGLVLMFAGVAEVVGGLVVGWLSDRLGRSFTVLLGTLFYGAYAEAPRRTLAADSLG